MKTKRKSLQMHLLFGVGENAMLQSRLTRPSWTQLHAFTSPRCQRRRAACVQCLALRIAVVGGGAAGLTAAYFASGASGAEVGAEGGHPLVAGQRRFRALVLTAPALPHRWWCWRVTRRQARRY